MTALDEARVVCSLVADDGLTTGAVARLLGHKPDWVDCRVALGTRLSETAAHKLGSGAFGPTLARALCELGKKDQDAVVASIERHGLKAGDAMVVVQAYQAADAADRRELLRDPLGRVHPEPRSPATSPRAAEIERRLESMRRILRDLAAFALPEDLTPAEQRRLEALHRGVLDELCHTARVLGLAEVACRHLEDDHERDHDPTTATPLPAAAATAEERGGGSARDPRRDPEAPRPGLRQSPDRQAGGQIAQDRAPSPRRGGASRPPPASAQSKLDPFAEPIASRVQQGLTVTRILREIRLLGYQGGRTILAKRVQTLKAQITLAPTRPVKRRFETRPAPRVEPWPMLP